MLIRAYAHSHKHFGDRTAVPTDEQVDPVAEQNVNQVDEPEHATVPTREFVPKP